MELNYHFLTVEPSSKGFMLGHQRIIACFKALAISLVVTNLKGFNNFNLNNCHRPNVC